MSHPKVTRQLMDTDIDWGCHYAPAVRAANVDFEHGPGELSPEEIAEILATFTDAELVRREMEAKNPPMLSRAGKVEIPAWLRERAGAERFDAKAAAAGKDD